MGQNPGILVNIPRAFSSFFQESSVVLDPMGGVGTIAIEARLWRSWPCWRFSKVFLPGHSKECFLEFFCYIKPTKKHSFGCLGMFVCLSKKQTAGG